MTTWRDRFVDELGALSPVLGIPRAMLRVQAWLMVCDPVEQSAQQVQERLALSAGAVSAALRGLVDAGMLERVSRTGERRTLYRIASGGWDGPLQAQLRGLAQLREVADRGIAAAGTDADFRLTDMRQAFAWFETSLRDFLDHRAAARAAEPDW